MELFLILMAMGWLDWDWAMRGIATFLTVVGILGFLSTIYALLALVGIRVKHDPTGPYTFEHDPVDKGVVLVTFAAAIIFAALSAAIFSFLP